MATYVLSIDQGTTSSRAVVYDAAGRAIGSAGRELTQHYPQPGWVEHDAEEIWTSVADVVPRALAEAHIEATQLQAIGLTNQRETVVVWERDSGRPVARAIVWQDRRTSDFCQARQSEEAWLRERTGLILDPYFSATKFRWLLKEDAALRRRAGRPRAGDRRGAAGAGGQETLSACEKRGSGTVVLESPTPFSHRH